MADFWGMSFFLSLEDDDIFYPILWIMLNIALFAFMTALWNWKEERQRKCQHGGNREDSRGAPHPLALSPLPTVWDFHSSSQHARMLSSSCSSSSHYSAIFYGENTVAVLIPEGRNLSLTFPEAFRMGWELWQSYRAAKGRKQ